MFFLFHDHYHVTDESRATEYCIRNQFAAFPLLLKWKKQCSVNRRNWILDKTVSGKTVMWNFSSRIGTRARTWLWWSSSGASSHSFCRFYDCVNTVKLICMTTLVHKLYCICNFFSKIVQNIDCELGTNAFALNIEVNRTNLFIYFLKTAPLS